MSTTFPPVAPRFHQPAPTETRSREDGGAVIAGRLGLPQSALLAYLDANGGAPDGRNHSREEHLPQAWPAAGRR